MTLPAVFFELHSGLKQQGPGSESSTRRALSLVGDLPNEPSVLDIGCGPGRQTITLATYTGGLITAVDNHRPFLDELAQRAEATGVQTQVTTSLQSMSDLDFAPESFDLIWSEGAIYIMGFEAGLKAWRPLLKRTGFMAVSEVAWLTDAPEPELIGFWNREYPGIKTVSENLDIVLRSGLTPVGHFILPESDWWDGYYSPLESRLAILREKYAGDSEALDVLSASQEEIDLYRKYSRSYGYAFFVMRPRI
jgi:SAM-dependent methyltransferase